MWRSLVARLLWEQDVAGSNPVIPTSDFTGAGTHRLFFCAGDGKAPGLAEGGRGLGVAGRAG